jgi:hypothetical protein
MLRKDNHLQDVGLDGEMHKYLRRQTDRDAKAIRAKWQDASDVHNILVINQIRERLLGGDASGDRTHGLVAQSWIWRLITPYAWNLIPWARMVTRQLCAACEDGDVKMVGRLLARGAYTSGVSEAGFTPLVYAIRGQHIDIINMLIKSHVDVNKAGVVNPLLEAVETKNLAVVETIVKAGAELDFRDRRDNRFRGITALHRASDLNLPDIVYLLLARGANYKLTYCDHTVGLHRVTPLHVAKGQCAWHLRQMAENNSDWLFSSEKDSCDRTPLFWAMERDDKEAVGACRPHWSTARGLVDINGDTVLHILCKRLSRMPLTTDVLSIGLEVIPIEPAYIRRENKTGLSPLMMLADIVANWPLHATDEDERVFEACKREILRTDLVHVTRQAYPDDYYDGGMAHCFGTLQRTEQEQAEHTERYNRRTIHEAEALEEQRAMFESLIAKSKVGTA